MNVTNYTHSPGEIRGILDAQAKAGNDLLLAARKNRIDGLEGCEISMQSIFNAYVKNGNLAKALEIPSLCMKGKEQNEAYETLAIAYAEQKNVFKAKMVKDSISDSSWQKETWKKCEEIFSDLKVPL